MEGLTWTTCMGDGETLHLKEAILFSEEQDKPGDPPLELLTVGHSPSSRQERPLNMCHLNQGGLGHCSAPFPAL